MIKKCIICTSSFSLGSDYSSEDYINIVKFFLQGFFQYPLISKNDFVSDVEKDIAAQKLKDNLSQTVSICSCCIAILQEARGLRRLLSQIRAKLIAIRVNIEKKVVQSFVPENVISLDNLIYALVRKNIHKECAGKLPQNYAEINIDPENQDIIRSSSSMSSLSQNRDFEPILSEGMEETTTSHQQMSPQGSQIRWRTSVDVDMPPESGRDSVPPPVIVSGSVVSLNPNQTPTSPNLSGEYQAVSQNVYRCVRCNQCFNREASLLAHLGSCWVSVPSPLSSGSGGSRSSTPLLENVLTTGGKRPCVYYYKQTGTNNVILQQPNGQNQPTPSATPLSNILNAPTISNSNGRQSQSQPPAIASQGPSPMQNQTRSILSMPELITLDDDDDPGVVTSATPISTPNSTQPVETSAPVPQQIHNPTIAIPQRQSPTGNQQLPSTMPTPNSTHPVETSVSQQIQNPTTAIPQRQSSTGNRHLVPTMPTPNSTQPVETSVSQQIQNPTTAIPQPQSPTGNRSLQIATSNASTSTSTHSISTYHSSGTASAQQSQVITRRLRIINPEEDARTREAFETLFQASLGMPENHTADSLMDLLMKS